MESPSAEGSGDPSPGVRPDEAGHGLSFHLRHTSDEASESLMSLGKDRHSPVY